MATTVNNSQIKIHNNSYTMIHTYHDDDFYCIASSKVRCHSPWFLCSLLLPIENIIFSCSIPVILREEMHILIKHLLS